MRARPGPLTALTASVLALGAAVAGGGGLPGARPASDVTAGAAAVAAVPGGVHLTAAGDFGATSNTWAVLDAVDDADPDAMLALGDLSYGVTGAEQAWCDQVVQRVGAGFAFELLTGNHESNGLNGNINDFSACLPNQLPGLVGTYGREWYVDVPAADPLVRVVMLSPGIDFPGQARWQYTVGSPRYQWAAAAIDGARAAGVPWVVVGMHFPCLSVGQYACDSGNDLHQLMLTKKVDLVLSGHEHLYQRTHQLGLRPGCTMTPGAAADLDCVVDADAEMVRGAGTVFATVGTGGIQQRAVAAGDPEEPYFATANGLATASWGFLDLQVTPDRLDARWVRASGTAYSDAFSLVPGGGANTPPTALASASCTGLTCTFDGSASTDGDGVVTTYAWDLGDGTTATGATTSHTYAADGTYTATLTVTDDDGATASAQRTVQVAAPTGPTVVAADTFARTVSRGWGSAETGGAWRTSGSLDLYSVSGGAGRIRLAAAGAGPDVSLPATASSTDLVLTVRADKLPAGGNGLYLSPSPRRVGGVGEYRAKVQLRGDGRVLLSLVRVVGTTQTALTTTTLLPGPAVTAGEGLVMRTQAVGTNPTTIRARVWEEGTPEPTTWQATATDATSGLQAPGSVGLNTYLSSGVTAAPIVLSLDDVRAVVP